MIELDLLDRDDAAKKFGLFLVKPTGFSIALYEILKRRYNTELVGRRDRIKYNKIRDLNKIY